MSDYEEACRCKKIIRDMNLRIKELQIVQALIECGLDTTSLSNLIRARMEFCNGEINQAKARETELTGKKHNL